MSAAHGLTRAPAPPAWPRIGPELAAVLSAWPQLGALRRIAWHAPRPFAATARVETESGTVFVKRHHPALRDVGDLAVEHRFAAHVGARLAGIVVPRALAARDGVTAVAASGWVWEVLPPVPGLDRHRDTLSWEPAASDAEACAAGQALARFHDAAEGFDAPARTARWLVGRLAPLDAADPLRALQRMIAGDAVLSAALHRWPDWRDACARTLAPFLDALSAYPPLPPCWAHGDWHVSNLLWAEDGAVASVLDFGLCDRAHALFDLATAIERNAVAWLDLGGPAPIARPDRAAALLAGYHAIRPLAPSVRAHLAALLPVVHLGFALSEIGYFHALHADPAAVTLAYEGFLLGHAAWFDSADGVSLLAALR